MAISDLQFYTLSMDNGYLQLFCDRIFSTRPVLSYPTLAEEERCELPKANPHKTRFDYQWLCFDSTR